MNGSVWPTGRTVLGISAFYHDSAVALVRDGAILAAAQEERFSRIKGDAAFPARAMRYCLESQGITLDQVDYVGFYDKPLLTYMRLLETYLAYAPRGLASLVHSLPLWIKQKLFISSHLLQQLNALGCGKVTEEQILFSFHHHAHAASAFYPSPFDRAAVLVLDGVGEWATTTLGRGDGTRLELLREMRFPHSLGMLYAAFTYYLGFKINDGEYKVMGLAPYGKPRYAALIRERLLRLQPDGSFHLNMNYFNYCTGLTMTNDRFAALFDGIPARPTGFRPGQREMDLAASIQQVTEEIILALAHTLHRDTGEKNLCLAGGVALNCVANGRLWREGPFEKIWIQPASGDAGGALGVALTISHAHGVPRVDLGQKRDAMQGAYLGPMFEQEAILAVLTSRHAVFHWLDQEEALLSAVVDALTREKVVGWFQGRMEYGPRALGNRSILGDPRSPRMQRTINMRIKYRESFRPFAPAVLHDRVSHYFEFSGETPYMLFVAPVHARHRRELGAHNPLMQGMELLDVQRSVLPAITHVDYSSRIQTVHPDTNPRFHRLLETFEQRTGCGVLINTSFNVRNEPIVCTPEDAYRCFMGTEMDVLVLDNAILFKEEQ
ncbi:MAG: carbamoyltransferase [Magnetococcales bacterium]|nr:carbamoyltransferase [Magnetococcales bacterium]